MVQILTRLRRINIKLLIHFSLAVFPLILFTAILLCLVFLNPFDTTRVVGNLSLDTSFTSSTLYVNYSSTRLILVGSFSSSVALPVLASDLTLTSYPVAADMIWSTQSGHHMLLPTPSQIAMLTDLLDAKQMAILTWLGSFLRKDGRKVPSRWIVEFPAITQLAALGLSVAIIAADTWLHVATRSRTKPFLFPVDQPESMGSGYLYSRDLTRVCTDTSQSVCTVSHDTGGSPGFSTLWSPEIEKLISGSADYDTQIGTTKNEGYYLAPRLPQRAGSSAIDILADQTFTATSFNVSAQCGDGIRMCESNTLDSNSNTLSFKCGGEVGMHGEVDLSHPVRIGSWWQGNGTYDDMFQYYQNSSQVDVGIVMLLANVSSQHQQDNTTNSLVVARCNLTFNAVRYDWTNDTTTPLMVDSPSGPSPTDLSRLARGPVLAGYFDNSSSVMGQARDNPFLKSVAIPSVNATSDKVVTKVQGIIGYYGISLLGGAFQATPAQKLSLPDSIIVTEVGKAPLFTLVILNLWYASFGILLFGIAMYVLRDPETSKDIREVQELISVHGLATSAVKRHRHNLDSADLRVGVEKVDGVWQFRVFEMKSASDESKSLLAHVEEVEVA